MATINEITSYIGIIIVTIMILIIGINLVPLADRGPGYVARNVAFTLDAVAASPGEVSVEYDFYDKDVSMIWIEEAKGKVHVSRFDMCSYVRKLINEGTKASVGMILDGVWEIGRSVKNLVGLSVAESPITGYAAGSITKHFTNPKDWDDDNKYEAVKDQIKTAHYKKNSNVEYKFEVCSQNVVDYVKDAVNAIINFVVCEDPIPVVGEILNIICDWTGIDNYGDCDQLVAAFFGDPAYVEPDKLIIGKTENYIIVNGVNDKC
jgi:hypothetical protein